MDEEETFIEPVEDEETSRLAANMMSLADSLSAYVDEATAEFNKAETKKEFRGIHASLSEAEQIATRKLDEMNKRFSGMVERAMNGENVPFSLGNAYGTLEEAYGELLTVIDEIGRKLEPQRRRRPPINVEGALMANDSLHKDIYGSSKYSRRHPISARYYDGFTPVPLTDTRITATLESELTLSEKALEAVEPFFKPNNLYCAALLYGHAKANPGVFRIYGTDLLKIAGIEKPNRPEHADALKQIANTVIKMQTTTITASATVKDKNGKAYKGVEYRHLLEARVAVYYYTTEEEAAAELTKAAKAAAVKAKRSKDPSARAGLQAEADRLKEEAEAAKAEAAEAKKARLSAQDGGEEQDASNKGDEVAEIVIDLMFPGGEAREAVNAMPLLERACTANEVLLVKPQYLLGLDFESRKIGTYIYNHCGTGLRNADTIKVQTIVDSFGLEYETYNQRRYLKAKLAKIMDTLQQTGALESWEFSTKPGSRGSEEIDSIKVHGFTDKHEKKSTKPSNRPKNGRKNKDAHNVNKDAHNAK